MLVGWFVSSQDYSRTTLTICMKLGEKVLHGPRKNPVHFGADTNVSLYEFCMAFALDMRSTKCHSCNNVIFRSMVTVPL